MTVTKTPLLKRIEDMEAYIDLLMTFVNNQNDINQKLVAQVRHLSETTESDTDKPSGLILPPRLNS